MRISQTRLASINPWHYVWISVLVSELFTLIANTVQSLLWWGHISFDLLVIGTIDAFFVSLIVAALVIYFIRYTSSLSQQNAELAEQIAQRIEVEKALKNSEEKYRMVADNLRDCIWAVDLDSLCFTYLSPSVEWIIGFTPDELRGRPLREILTPESFERCFTNLQQELAWEVVSPPSGPQASRVMEAEQVRRDGSRFWAEVTVTVARDAQGQPIALLGVSRDITERKQADEALRKSEQKYRDLFDNISDFIYTHDMEGRFLSVNRAVYEKLGNTEEEAVGRMISDFISPDHAADFHDNYLPRIRAQGQDSGTLLLITKHGQPCYLEYRNSLVHGSDGVPYVRGSGRDITERIFAEREKRLLEKQLLQAQKMEAVGTLASGVAHDFNNILQITSGYLQIIKSGQTPGPTHKKYLAEMESALHRAAVLTRQLLTLSRKGAVHLTPLNLTEVIRQTISILRRTIPKTIVLDTQLSAEPCIINGDPNQVDQILLNLANNAVDAMGDSGTLVLETVQVRLDEDFCRTHFQVSPGDYVLLRVSDNGSGMDQETVNHVFEPFFTTKQPGRGTGLGLSTVYSLVKKYGGYINCYSEVGLGTTFNLYFPAIKSADKKETDNAVPPASIPHGTETILLVDDEIGIIELGKLMLQSHGYQVLTAEDGLKALEVYQAQVAEIDLVILDLGMPKMSGQRCLNELLKIKPELKVVVASGYSLQGPAKGILEAGARGYVSKPYQMAEMMTIIREVLDGPDGPRGRPSQYDAI